MAKTPCITCTKMVTVVYDITPSDVSPVLGEVYAQSNVLFRYVGSNAYYVQQHELDFGFGFSLFEGSNGLCYLVTESGKLLPWNIEACLEVALNAGVLPRQSGISVADQLHLLLVAGYFHSGYNLSLKPDNNQEVATGEGKW